jgi:ribosomal protein S18 acetylase RimI-like enzyme
MRSIMSQQDAPRNDEALVGLAERDAASDDFEALYRLHEETMRTYVVQTYGSWEEEDQRRRFLDAFTRRRPRVLVDPSERGPVVASFSVESRDRERFLSSIEVARSHRGRKIGTAIVERFVREARTAGVRATLQVLKANPRARKLYERLGFVITGETATHVAMQVDFRLR